MAENISNTGIGPERLAEPGLRTGGGVLLTNLNVLPQIREYYPPEYIAELADSMRFESADGQVSYRIIHDTTIARLDETQAKEYLAEHGEHYGRQHNLEGLTPVTEEDGTHYYILIAGHCRRLALMSNCDRDNRRYEDTLLPAKILDGISFEEALVLQVRENVHLRTSPQEDAHNIARYVALRERREGVRPTYEECARVLGHSPTKIAEAMRFSSLPAEVQAFADSRHPVLPYGVVVQMHPLYEALARYHQDVNKAAAEVTGFAKHLVSLKLGGDKTSLSSIIKARTEEVRGQAAYTNGELFVLEEFGIVPERDAAGRKMAKLALNALIYRLTWDGITDEEAAKIKEIAALLEARAAAKGSQGVLDL